MTRDKSLSWKSAPEAATAGKTRKLSESHAATREMEREHTHVLFCFTKRKRKQPTESTVREVKKAEAQSTKATMTKRNLNCDRR